MELALNVPAPPDIFNYPNVATQLSTLDLMCLSMGEDFVLVHRPKFDIVLEGEPHQTLQMIVHMATKEYMVRVWGQTHTKGTVASVADFKNLCEKFFCDSRVCPGLPRKLDKTVRSVSYPVRRFMSSDCLKISFGPGKTSLCSSCQEVSEEYERKSNSTADLSQFPEVKLEVGDLGADEEEEEDEGSEEQLQHEDNDDFGDLDNGVQEERYDDPGDAEAIKKRDEALAIKIEEVIKNNDAPIIKNEEMPKDEFRCEECGKEYKNFGCLSNHERKVHGKSREDQPAIKDLDLGPEKPKRYRFKHYSCDICHKPFESKLLCLEHRTSHTGDKLFYCEECGKGFGFLSSYKYHVRIHMRAKGMLTDNSQNSLYHFCEHCGKKFSDKHCLTNHINNQHLKKMTKLPCSVCGVICQSRNQLLVHMNRKHRTDGRYQCNTCGKRFGAKNTLDRHQLVHNEPQLECRFCGKKVKKQENLLNHERIHTGETPFK